jgi:leader peptidase (prepilin peptidase)/N-methyltransferase
MTSVGIVLSVLLGLAGLIVGHLMARILLTGRLGSWSDCLRSANPAVAGVTGLLWALLAAWTLAGGMPVSLLPLVLTLTSAGVALTVIDVRHHRLPDAVVLPLYPITVVGLAIDGLARGAWPVWSALLGAAVWLIAIGVPWLVSGGRGMGFGDVKLAPILGATLGWVAVPIAIVGLVLAFVLGAAVGVALMMGKRADRRTPIPFGPFLLAGALLGLVAGRALVTAYGELLVAS